MTQVAKIASDARLLRQSGHPQQSAKVLEAAVHLFPDDPILLKESRALQSHEQRSFKRCRLGITKFLDSIGAPGAIILSLLLAYLLAPILFVSAG